MCAEFEIARYAEEIRRAVNGRADENREQWDCLRRRLRPRPVEHKINLAEVYQAYEEASGTLIGCD